MIIIGYTLIFFLSGIITSVVSISIRMIYDVILITPTTTTMSSSSSSSSLISSSSLLSSHLNKIGIDVNAISGQYKNNNNEENKNNSNSNGNGSGGGNNDGSESKANNTSIQQQLQHNIQLSKLNYQDKIILKIRNIYTNMITTIHTSLTPIKITTIPPTIEILRNNVKKHKDMLLIKRIRDLSKKSSPGRCSVLVCSVVCWCVV